MYYYKLFGLTVKSEFEIPEAVAIDALDTPDVLIESGMPPKEDFDAAQSGVIDRLEKDVCWFNLAKYGMFYVENGNHVIIHSYGDEMTDLQRNSYLTGSTMGLVMFQRGIIPIHSGAVAKDGKTVLVVGDSGSGKSTNTVRLREKGCLFVSDDMSPVSFADGKVMISPAFPQQKLCRDAALRQGYQLEDLIYIDEDRDKYAIRLQDGYETEDTELSMILELEATDTEEFSITEVRGLEKIKLIYRNIYRGCVWNVIGMQEEVQRHVLELAQKVPMYKCMRPNKGFYTEQITDWVLQHM